MNESGAMASMNEAEMLAELERIVRHAGRMAMDLRPHLDVRRKADGSVVTQADVAIEDFLAAELGRLRPDAAFVGEERPLPAVDANAPAWIVDPIDGTDGYRQGLAYFGVSVGLARGTDFLLAAFFNPQLNEMYLARRGGGATRNGAPIRVQQRAALAADCVVCGPGNFHRVFRAGLRWEVRSFGSTATHLALVADGRICFCVCRPRLWDVGAGVLLVQEAGGAVRYLDGRAFDPSAHYDGRAIRPPLAAGAANLVDAAIAQIGWAETAATRKSETAPGRET